MTVLSLPPYIWYCRDGPLSSTLQGAVDGPQDFMDTWQALYKLNLIPSLAAFSRGLKALSPGASIPWEERIVYLFCSPTMLKLPT